MARLPVPIYVNFHSRAGNLRSDKDAITAPGSEARGSEDLNQGSAIAPTFFGGSSLWTAAMRLRNLPDEARASLTGTSCLETGAKAVIEGQAPSPAVAEPAKVMDERVEARFEKTFV